VNSPEPVQISQIVRIAPRNRSENTYVTRAMACGYGQNRLAIRLSQALESHANFIRYSKLDLNTSFFWQSAWSNEDNSQMNRHTPFVFLGTFLSVLTAWCQSPGEQRVQELLDEASRAD